MTNLTKYNRSENWPLWSSPFRILDEAMPTLLGRSLFSDSLRSWAPAVDVSEDENALTFTAEVPGFSKDDLHISIENGMLSLSGERSLEGKREEYNRVERTYGKFERSFSLPSTVDANKIQADLKNGLLTITVPRREEARPRRISVQAQ